MGTDFLIQEFNESVFGTFTFVIFRSSSSLGEVFDRWVRLDAMVFSRGFGVFGSSINFSDYYCGLRSEISC